MKTDSLFYRLFQAMPRLALELAGLSVPEAVRYEFRSEEIKQTAFRLDGVLMPTAATPDVCRSAVPAG
jgi:predicted transposase YdaD